ncbi:hypothetical protein I79_004072 [Cricetulus griseus]|uniref:Uncharacterized protein n=1 Tax=Cricetulus griseus TaxID=10029 RepID=G3H1M3_CRIGR|nr:hypothetical protein I79_004072 [Cricetulus griseus]
MAKGETKILKGSKAGITSFRQSTEAGKVLEHFHSHSCQLFLMKKKKKKKLGHKWLVYAAEWSMVTYAQWQRQAGTSLQLMKKLISKNKK